MRESALVNFSSAWFLPGLTPGIGLATVQYEVADIPQGFGLDEEPD